MDFSIASILALDGATNGAIYALLALALILVFAVTRVVFIPQGEYVAFGALSLALLQEGKVPGTVWLLLSMAVLCLGMDAVEAVRHKWSPARYFRRIAQTALPAIGVSLVALVLAPLQLGLWVQVLLSLALVTALGPLVYRVAFQSLADASVLVLLIVSIGVHFALTGLGLVFFGAEGYRTPAFWDTRLQAGPLSLQGQHVIIFGATLALIVGLYLYFARSLSGKALQATAINRAGARLMGISTDGAGVTSFTLAAFLGGLSGLLIGPTTTIFYDSGFLIGLKGFVAAVFAGLSSYPMAMLGALLVGLIESFGSFWASSFKEVIVFTAILPVLLWRSFFDQDHEEH
jgi:branched-chain amino acid transport system permease protein